MKIHNRPCLSFQHGVLESKSTWTSPEASMQTWMPAIHASMTNAIFSSSVPEPRRMQTVH